MKSPEQMGEMSEQPDKEEIMEDNGEKERKITTPEEAAEITKQRRKNFGLEEAKELTQEQAVELEKSIEKLLNELFRYDSKDFSPEIQDEWDYIEQEAEAGKDRELVKTNLERFIEILAEITAKKITAKKITAKKIFGNPDNYN